MAKRKISNLESKKKTASRPVRESKKKKKTKTFKHGIGVNLWAWDLAIKIIGGDVNSKPGNFLRGVLDKGMRELQNEMDEKSREMRRFSDEEEEVVEEDAEGEESVDRLENAVDWRDSPDTVKEVYEAFRDEGIMPYRMCSGLQEGNRVGTDPTDDRLEELGLIEEAESRLGLTVGFCMFKRGKSKKRIAINPDNKSLIKRVINYSRGRRGEEDDD